MTTSRRKFLKQSAAIGGGLTIGCGPLGVFAQKADAGAEINAWVVIRPDDGIIIRFARSEMGQGSMTSAPMLVAEELGCDWRRVKIESASANANVRRKRAWGDMAAVGSRTIRNSQEYLRKAGATAREMLIAAAAQEWGVPASECAASNSFIVHGPGPRRISFGKVAEAAAKLEPPKDVKLKDPKDWKLIGKSVKRVDIPDTVMGRQRYGIDTQLPGMLYAAIAQCPVFGGKVKAMDASKVEGRRGIVKVLSLETFVAVVGDNWWRAKEALRDVHIDWDVGANGGVSSASLMEFYRGGLDATQDIAVARKDGDFDQAFAGAAKKLEAEYYTPYLAHACMEPMNCVVKLSADACEIWNGEQFQSIDQPEVAAVLGLKPEQVKLNMLFAGGSFGRRANPHADYVVEAAQIAKAHAEKSGGRVPVKLVWTREDDMRAGSYRPMYYHALKAGLDAQGNIVAWQHRIVGQSILGGTVFEGMMVKDGIDATSVEGAANLPYAVPNLGVDLHSPRMGVPVQWWRSVGSTHTAFSTETFLDELALAAGKDPYQVRRSLLAKSPRHKTVLEMAATESDWTTPLVSARVGERRGRGIAVHESFNTVVAQVAEVTVRRDGSWRVDRVMCAVDCGVAVNPDVIRAQMESGIVYGLTAAMYGAITLKDGAVEQSNFHDYMPLRMNEMPRIGVYIARSNEKPTGVGEPATPVIAPAVANALFAATGKPIRSLPIRLQA